VRSSVTWRTMVMQPSKSVSRDSTSAPLAMGWISCAADTLLRGRKTIDGIPAAAQYAARAADVSPVEAQAMARTADPRAMISFTTLTSTVIPRSLKEPVWLTPDILIQRSSSPRVAP